MGAIAGGVGGAAVDHRREVCRRLAVSFERLTIAEQVHGTRIATVTADRAGGGRDALSSHIRGVDGLVTDVPGVPLMVLGADCAMLLVFDPARPAIGVAHAGWRGTAAGMGGAVVEHMVGCFSSLPGELLVAISPCVHACCYEVQQDVLAAFGRDAGAPVVRRGGSAVFLDLPGTLMRQMESAGVRRANMDVAEACTVCSGGCFSYRREGAPAGRMALIAALQERAMRG